MFPFSMGLCRKRYGGSLYSSLRSEVRKAVSASEYTNQHEKLCCYCSSGKLRYYRVRREEMPLTTISGTPEQELTYVCTGTKEYRTPTRTRYTAVIY